MSEAFDFSRYAPGAPELVWTNEALQDSADLALALNTLKATPRIVWLASRIVAIAAARSARARLDRLMQSLLVSWSCAGAGWGAAFGLAATLLWMR